MRTTLVIATADRPEPLAATLQALAACERPESGAALRVVVADNGTDPATRAVCEQGQPGLRVDYLTVDRGGKTVAQNRAVAATDAELLVFTDDDVEFDSRWLIELQRAAYNWPERLLFGGRITPVWPDGGCPKYLKDSAYLGLLFTRLDLGDEEGPIPDFRPLGPNMAVRREAFDRGVRFDEEIGPGSNGVPMGDELDLTFQLQTLGQTAVYVPTSRVYHRVRDRQLSLRWQLKRGIDYGRMTAHFEREAPARTLLNIPLWIYRAVPERCAAAVWNFIRGRRGAAFDAIMRAAFAVGQARAPQPPRA